MLADLFQNYPQICLGEPEVLSQPDVGLKPDFSEALTALSMDMNRLSRVALPKAAFQL